MRLQKEQTNTSSFKKLIVPIAAILFVGYALWVPVSSGVVPGKHSVVAAVAYILWSMLILVLFVRTFSTRLRTVIARLFAVLLTLLVLAAAVFGLYMFNKGLSTLDSIATVENAVTVDTAQSFNIFISGIDTYGDIGSMSRSDVNIVATVNPNTHKILLTTAPRDSYVSIAMGGNDGMDKLTHAGIYGPQASMATMARLLSTDIDAYMRINFTSFIESIDTLGGITLQNPTTFTIDGVTFPEGELQLDGKKALLYSRERKSLAAGDIDRGKNQQRVIQGVVDKMAGIRTLGEFDTVLSLIGSNIDTNMSQETIRSLVSKQLESPSGWTTESITLTGKGQTGGLPSYAMPDAQLYMYVLDQSSVDDAARRIAELQKDIPKN